MDLFWHDDVLLHDTGAGAFDRGPDELLAVPESHPENGDRVRNMRSVLARGPLAGAIRERAGRHAGDEELLSLHEPAYVAELRRVDAAGGGTLTTSTALRPGSLAAALAAAGTAVAAADAVLAGEADVAYALVRPPGHHAQPAAADGYCFFNNAGLAAERARRRGCERVAIIDWDVHHGNGTQECFWTRGDVLAVSLHMRHGSWGPSHPQTGAPDEVGAGDGTGYNVNVELPLGTGDAGYLEAMAEVVVPVVDAFRPDFIVIASGQDANQFDPNGRQAVTMDGFRRLGAVARELAERHCDGRLVLVQEGGYARTYSALCLHATVEGVLGAEPALPDRLAFLPDDPAPARAAIAAVRRALDRVWPALQEA